METSYRFGVYEYRLEKLITEGLISGSYAKIRYNLTPKMLRKLIPVKVVTSRRWKSKAYLYSVKDIEAFLESEEGQKIQARAEKYRRTRKQNKEKNCNDK